MSAAHVGQVYQKIIDDVISDSATNFDEGGVERQLLDDLKTSWQDKLSARHVAEMPWDPAPASQSLSLPQPSSLPASTPAPAAPTPAPVSAIPPVKPEPIIKQEREYPEYVIPSVVPASQQGTSLQRAGQFIQDKFGQAANGSLSALQAQQQARQAQAEQQQQARQAQQAQQQAALQAQLNMQGMSSDASRQHYNRMLAEQMMTQQKLLQGQQQQQRPLAHGQTDGADEWKAFVAERRALTDDAVLAADMTFRQRIEQLALETEGGLMLPASQVRVPRVPLRRDTGTKHSQLDGVDGDDIKPDEDEDAINSELDDPEDEAAVNSDDEDNGGEVMLCLYDKVQRVKNKWKCTLKEGILSTGGKEYVFQKAQGEFEW